MTSFQTLPPEILSQIVSCLDYSYSYLRNLKLTCRRLSKLAEPFLHRKALQDHTVLLQLVRNDQGDILEPILHSQVKPKWAAPQHYLDSCLHDALLGGHVKAADAFINNGAEIFLSDDVIVRSEFPETREWLEAHDATGLGSLALAARSRYHMTFWYKGCAPYASEKAFWECKRKVMKRILEKLEIQIPKHDPILARELDMALAEAANADGHSIELMEFLFNNDASVSCKFTPQVAGKAWHNALNEEIPALFEAKVDWLLLHDVDPTKVWTWEGMRTLIQFFLRKSYRSFQCFEEGSAFTNKVFGYMEYLESWGCLHWPQSTLRSFVLSIGTVQINCIIDYPRTEEYCGMLSAGGDNADDRRELELIFNEPDESLQPLRVALSNQIALKHFRDLVILPSPTFREWFDKESMPTTIQNLDKLFRDFSG
ncbi:hypothetical protein CSAL01_07667 [Colletotrichum salicis]|uniref:F-box domain-containing protein n=1 Tax=Colletotrichum salicis TaxID=1209931 RepID=A0A135U5P5_9PEZI|nr:hypothetical protein CSAL01_07667 [Colletotrichum salicis]